MELKRFIKWALRILFVSVSIIPNQSMAQATYSDYATIGPRATYTFGKDGGWKFGFEVSYFPRIPVESPLPYGLTLDVLFQSSSAVTLHAGIETVNGVGVDIGPSVTFTNSRLYPAITAIAFAGLFVYPALEYTVYLSPSMRNYLSLGAYLKFPIDKGFSDRYGFFQSVG